MNNKLHLSVFTFFLFISHLTAVYETAPGNIFSSGTGQTGVVYTAPGNFAANPAISSSKSKINLGLTSGINGASSAGIFGMNEVVHAEIEAGKIGHIGALLNYFRYGIDYTDWKADWNEFLIKAVWSKNINEILNIEPLNSLRLGAGISFGAIGGGDDEINSGETGMNVDIDAGVQIDTGLVLAGISGNNLIRANKSFTRSINAGVAICLKENISFDITPILEVGYLFDFKAIDLRAGLAYLPMKDLRISAGCAMLNNFDAVIPTIGAGYNLKKFQIGYSFAYNIAMGGSGEHSIGLGMNID